MAIQDLGGRREGQKFKSLLVWQILLRHTDENHPLSAEKIVELLEDYGVTSGEHSVCRDIKELQRLYEGDEEECFDQGERFKYKIVYDGSGKRGYKVVKKMDLRTYTQKVFSMFGGEEKRVRIRFTNDLLDTVIERFGASDPTYTKFDDTHFTVSAAVEVSNMFYSWVCSFRKKAVILNPPEVVDGFQQFLSDIQGRYEQGQ